jgi:lambda family phage minor tail protein L
MSNSNLIVTDSQSLEISSPLVELYELEYDSATTLYFHPGLTSSVRITKLDGATATLNSSQNVSVGTTLIFKGLNTSGSEVSVSKTVSGDNPATNTITLNSASDLKVGMVITGPGITDTDYSPVVYDGNTYYALPLAMTDLTISTSGVHNRPTLTIGNVESIIRKSSVFQNAEEGGTAGLSSFSLDNLISKRITKRQTLEKYLSIDPAVVSTKATVEFPKRTYIIDSIKQRTSQVVVFELANPFDLEGITLPNRQVIGKYCPWVYQGLSLDTPSGACSWSASSLINIDDDGTDRKYYPFFTDLDEPIIWKYLIHNSASPANILSGKTHSGSAGTSYAANALVALSDGGVFTYWRSEAASNTTVPSITNSLWQRVKLYEPFVSGLTYSANDYVIHPVTNATTKADTSFTILSTTRIYKAVITSNTETPSDVSNYWKRGDVCGKLLNSCKVRYQFKTVGGSSSADHNTVPGTALDTKQALPFGGFPGSRKI